jgi:hypothetical protein
MCCVARAIPRTPSSYIRARMATQLGLQEPVINNSESVSQTSTLPPRILSFPITLINREERIRAYWMTEVLDSMSSLGAGWHSGLSRPVEEAWFPCNETVWAFPENAKAFSSFGDSEVSSAFSVYLNLLTRQLYQVHMFLQQSFDTTSANDRLKWQAQCSAIDESLTTWRNSEDTIKTFSETNEASDSTLVMITVTFDTCVSIRFLQRTTFSD